MRKVEQGQLGPFVIFFIVVATLASAVSAAEKDGSFWATSCCMDGGVVVQTGGDVPFNPNYDGLWVVAIDIATGEQALVMYVSGPPTGYFTQKYGIYSIRGPHVTLPVYNAQALTFKVYAGDYDFGPGWPTLGPLMAEAMVVTPNFCPLPTRVPPYSPPSVDGR